MASKPLVTPSQPQSLLSCPTDNYIALVKVYYQNLDKNYKVIIDAESFTINDAISAAVRKLNQENKLGLINDTDQYELFAAKKDGSKNNGLPALQPHQLITKTQIKRFHLSPLYITNPQIETKDTISSIKSEYNMNSSKNRQVLDNNQGSSTKKFNFCGIICFGQ